MNHHPQQGRSAERVKFRDLPWIVPVHQSSKQQGTHQLSLWCYLADASLQWRQRAIRHLGHKKSPCGLCNKANFLHHCRQFYHACIFLLQQVVLQIEKAGALTTACLRGLHKLKNRDIEGAGKGPSQKNGDSRSYTVLFFFVTTVALAERMRARPGPC